MTELNPYRTGARIFALLCFLFTGFVVVIGVFFTLAAATADLSKLPVPKGTTNLSMAVTQACTFFVIAVMVFALGWRIRSLFGGRFLGDKLVAKSAVGCLTTSSLGCGMWALLSACSAFAIGQLVIEGDVIFMKRAEVGEVLIGASGFFLAVCVMLAIAWFISANFTELNQKERQAKFKAYVDDVQPRLHKMGEPGARLFVEGRTLEILTQLDPPLKRRLLDYLGENDLLTGPSRVRLGDANLQGVDLSSIRLPRADLGEVDLTKANLTDAYLYEANLEKAKLTGVNLTRANLQDANLREADLTNAVLEKTALTGADLTGAKVALPQLGRARLNKTIRPDGSASD